MNYDMHVVSGSDQKELRTICDHLELSTYFKSIHGSPTPKTELVKNLIQDNEYTLQTTCLIGDSINDFEAAKQNEIDFFGYNNNQLVNICSYISQFQK